MITGAFVLTESFANSMRELGNKFFMHIIYLFIYYFIYHGAIGRFIFYPIQIIAYLSGKIGRITGTWKRTSNEAYFSISKFSIVAVQHSKKYDIVVQKIGKT